MERRPREISKPHNVCGNSPVCLWLGSTSWLARAAEAAGTVEHVRRGRGGIAQPVPRGTPNHLWRWYLISTSASPPDCRCLDAPRPKPVRAARSVRAPRTPGRGARSFAETWIASDRAGSSGKPVRNTTASPMNPCCAPGKVPQRWPARPAHSSNAKILEPGSWTTRSGPISVAGV
jgi:hypothetical protein